jgi:hypothetical protein
MNSDSSFVNSWLRHGNVRSLTWLKERLQGSKWFFSYLLAAALFLSMWHSRVIHRFSLRAFAVFLVLCGLSLIYGRLFIKVTSFSFKAIHGFSIQFLCGYLLLNTLLFLLVLFTPFGIAPNVLILCGGGLLILLFCPGAAKDFRKPVDYLPDFLCLLLSGIAATLWCTDSLRPVVTEGPATVYQTFTDSFFHSRVLSTFAQSHGLKTISDLRMSGRPTALYHYAHYIAPAALLPFTKSSAYATFVSFLVPFGILLTGLAAFSLSTSIWGMWPGLAGMLAVTLLPDAYQQGFGNKALSYNFFQLAAPGGLYGVACLTIAWVFILDGCKAGTLVSILFGYAVLIMSLTYKAQFFVANAFLVMIYPCVFFPRLRIRWRIISATLLASLFVFVVCVSQRVESVPTLRLDGSSARLYAKGLWFFAEPGFFKSLFYGPLILHQPPTAIFGVAAVSMILVFTFGAWIIVYLFISFALKAKIGGAAFLFPLLVIVNYLVMSLGLALDAKGIGHPEELLHRPFVWAYFVLVAWTGAGAYAFPFGNGPPRTKSAGILAVIFAFSCFSVPIAYAHNIQTIHTIKRFESYRTFNSVPSALIKASSYIRRHSRPGDLIQDSENDPRFVVTALAERQNFATDCKLWQSLLDPNHIINPSPIELRRRLDELVAFKKMGDEASLADFIRRHKISWYVLRPESEVAWPTSFRDSSVFNSEGYRVYHFIP